MANQIIGKAEADLARDGTFRHLRPYVVIEGEQKPAPGEQSFTRPREPEAAPVPLEKPALQHVLEPLDLLADGSLSQIADIGGGRHARMIRHGNECPHEIDVEVACHIGIMDDNVSHYHYSFL